MNYVRKVYNCSMEYKFSNPEEYFRKIKNLSNNIVFYGAGSKAIQTIKLAKKHGIVPVCFCDANYKKYSKYGIQGIPVYSYEQMKKLYKDYVLILTVAINNALSIKEEIVAKGEKHEIFNMCNPFKVENTFLEYNDFLNDKDRYEKIYNLLEDKLSKELFIKNIEYKMTGNAFELFNQIDGESFFDENLIYNDKDNVYVDIGAYTGDTIARFYAFSRGKYKKIIGVEADKGNYSALCNMIKYARLENVKTLNNALWSEVRKMKFYTTSQENRMNYDSPNLYRDVVNTVDWKTKEEMKEKKISSSIEEIETQTIDNILIDEKPTIIKVNALGADLPILYGAKNTILCNKPVIIMEYGTKPEYILGQIEYLKNIRADYKFYFRQKKIFNDSKTILYAI